MQLDASTLLIASCTTTVMLGLTLLYFWHRDRRSTWLLWWALPWIIGGFAALTYVRPNWESDYVNIGIGNAARIAAIAMLWQGARVFDGRKPMLLPVAAIIIAWLAACYYPPFLHSMAARVVVVSFVIGVLCVLAAWELWRGREERLPSRIPAIAVFLSFAVVNSVRVLGFGSLPFALGAGPLVSSWRAACIRGVGAA